MPNVAKILSFAISFLFLEALLVTQTAKATEIAEAVLEIVGCSLLKDDRARLACFDKASATLKSAGIPASPITANTKEILSSFAPGDFKVVDPDDIHVAPRKFIGKPIEIRGVRCFYADKDDYRCITPSRLTTAVFGRSISPTIERDALEGDCGAIKRLESPACRKTIRVVLTDYSQDAPSAFAKRIVVTAPVIEIVPIARTRR